MLLYHGTTESRLGSIFRKGICPRRTTKVPTVWPDNPSRKDMTYFSVAYPFYFAIAALAEGERAIVLEIDSSKLDSERFYPDEDFIIQGTNEPHRKFDIRANLERWRRNWDLSLQRLGNVCYKGKVPPSAFVRYCAFDIALRPNIATLCMDPTITIQNYKYCGELYQGLVSWMFGDRPDIPNKMEIEVPEAREYWGQECSDRTGIEVVCLSKKMIAVEQAARA